jgi:hypothetical protein
MATTRTSKAPKRSPEPAKADSAGVLFIRDPDLPDELDAWAEKLNKANPDAPAWTRSSLARAVLRRALRERGAKGEMP